MTLNGICRSPSCLQRTWLLGNSVLAHLANVIGRLSGYQICKQFENVFQIIVLAWAVNEPVPDGHSVLSY